MGCALSHYNLWQQLLDDKDNEFYLILEDDVELCKGFNKKIADLVEEMAKKDVIYLGYFRYSSAERKQVIAEFKMITEDSEIMTLQKLNANKSGGGGTFCYSINKNAAKKYIDYIDKNGIKYAMDCFMVYPKNIESYDKSFNLTKNIYKNIQNFKKKFNKKNDDHIFLLNEFVRN